MRRGWFVLCWGIKKLTALLGRDKVELGRVTGPAGMDLRMMKLIRMKM